MIHFVNFVSYTIQLPKVYNAQARCASETQSNADVSLN